MKQTKQISLLMNHLRCRLEEQKQPGHYWTTMVPVLTAGWRTQMGMLGGGGFNKASGEWKDFRCTELWFKRSNTSLQIIVYSAS